MADATSSSAGPAKKSTKKAAKKTAGLRPRPASALLQNPALAGASQVAARSVFGKQDAPQQNEDGAAPAPEAPEDLSPPRSPSMPSAGSEEPRSGANADPGPAPGQNANTPSALSQSGSPTQPDETDVQALATAVSPSRTSTETDSDVQPAREEGQAKPPSQQAKGRSASKSQQQSERNGSKNASTENNHHGSAHAALLRSWHDSRMDLILKKHTWDTHPFRFVGDLLPALSTRAADDSASSNKTITNAQIVDAAMRLYLPDSIDKQLALAEEFLLSRGTQPGRGQQSSHRVSPEVYRVAANLSNELKRAGRARMALLVFSGALSRFLDDLAAEGPLVPGP